MGFDALEQETFMCITVTYQQLDPQEHSQWNLTHWGWDNMADIFQRIFLNENIWILIKISL